VWPDDGQFWPKHVVIIWRSVWKWFLLFLFWVLIEFLIVEGSGLIEIHCCLRNVCGEDAIDISSDTGSVFLRVVERISVTGHVVADQPQKWLLGQWRSLVSGILGEVQYSVQSIMCRHKDIKARDSKALAKEEDESGPSPACQCQTAHHSAQRVAFTTMGRTVLCHPPRSPNLAWFSWTHEGCTQETLLCRLQWALTQHVWWAVTLQQRVLHDQHIVSHT
jgi:hypothetical protein